MENPCPHSLRTSMEIPNISELRVPTFWSLMSSSPECYGFFRLGIQSVSLSCDKQSCKRVFHFLTALVCSRCFCCRVCCCCCSYGFSDARKVILWAGLQRNFLYSCHLLHTPIANTRARRLPTLNSETKTVDSYCQCCVDPWRCMRLSKEGTCK